MNALTAAEAGAPGTSPGAPPLGNPASLLRPPIPGVAESDLTRCFTALLALLGWRGGPDDMLGALPHAEPDPDLTDIRNALARLGFATRPQKLRRGGLDPRRLPALLVEPGAAVAVLYRDTQGVVMRFDGATGEARPTAHGHLAGRLYLLTDHAVRAPGRSWTSDVARRFTGDLPALLVISALITLLGLAVPLFTMAVFDTVIAGQSPDTLRWLVMGATTALVFEVLFRGLRRRALSRIGERLDRLIPSAVFSQLVGLPAALVERAGTAAQVSRLRDFAAIRDFLTGAFALAVLDLPFSLIVLALLVLLGGWVAVVPVLACLGFGLLFLVTRGMSQRAINAASNAAQQREVLALEALEAQRSLKLAGAEGRWTERYAEAAAEAALAAARASTVSGQVMVAAQALVTVSGLAALLVGVLAVLGGSMTAGALIAGMMLIWRVLGPLQTGFVMLSRWQQTQASIRQVDGMMLLESERPGLAVARMAPPARGDLVFQRVSLRYLAQSEPVLSGASFGVAHGELVAITGAEGAGKSSVLRLVAGLYRPQGGVVRIGGHDIRAYDPTVLRRAVAWVPQNPELFYGTVAQNLRLAAPSASDDDLRRAAEAAHARADIEALPQGFETRVGDNSTARLPRSLLLRITLARAILRDAPVLLLDEPVAGLDDACAAAFTAIIAARRGHATILMSTHRPSHVRLADRVLHVADGQIEEGAARSAASPLQRLPVFRVQGHAP